MWRRLVPKSVRTRLAIGHALSLALALGAYSVGLLYLYRANLYSDLDLKLRSQFESADDGIDELLLGQTPEALADPENWLTEIWTGAGTRVFSSSAQGDQPLGAPDASCFNQFDAFNTFAAGGLRVRVFCQPSSTHSGAYIIRVARVRERIEDQLHAFGAFILFGAPGIVLLSAVLGYLLARRALGPVAKLTASARSITASRLGDRLPIHNPDDELGQLATAFNDTFANLERSFQQMRRFTSDASHELRTPLTAIRAMGEVALRTKSSGTDPYETIGSILEETRHLQSLCESLLLLSRADAGQTRLKRTEISASTIVKELVDLLGILAEEKGQRFDIDVPDSIRVVVDSQTIKLAIGNLVDNAIKYSPHGSTIRITALDGPSGIKIKIADQGSGIAPQHLPHIFERFYRADEARGRTPETGAGGGVGLGLAIAQWAVQLHGGTINVVSDIEKGCTFTIDLPKNGS